MQYSSIYNKQKVKRLDCVKITNNRINMRYKIKLDVKTFFRV